MKPLNCFTCRTSRQGSKEMRGFPRLAAELLHLPDKPAGVEHQVSRLSSPELLHLPDKPAGVRIHSTNRKTRFSPCGQRLVEEHPRVSGLGLRTCRRA